ncbi:MAG TPA: phosphohistidine phosphatase SixA [Anaerolineae bacterium]|nr:phosphohistidine phosphatase SixA [Anaerolineae bacterium]
MELYLVQHGEAKRKTEDPQRPLTGRGRDEVQRVAAFAARTGLKVSQVRHSGKRRAEETASILAEHLSPSEGVLAVPGLDPMDDVRPIAQALQKETAPLMLVGHLPFMDRLAGLLVTSNQDCSVVRFRMGGIVCLEGEGDDWAIRWVLTPELVA